MSLGQSEMHEMEQYVGGSTYELVNPGIIDEVGFWTAMGKADIQLGHQVLMLPFGEGNQVGREKRLLYFEQAVGADGALNQDAVLKLGDGEQSTTTRILSYGDCNVACPYCKRDMQFIDDKGIPQESVGVRIDDVARLAAGAVERGEVVRFSGGDPVMYPKETFALAQWLFDTYGVKSSIAHNGSGPKLVVPFLSSAAIDLKAVPEKMGTVMGIESVLGQKRFELSLATQKLLSSNGVLLDVRTPIFGDTTLDEMRRLAEAITKDNALSHTFWTWRLYKKVEGCEWPVPEKEPVVEMMQKVAGEFPGLWMGMRAKWERGGMLFVRDGKIIEKKIN